MSARQRRGLVIIGIVLTPFIVGILFTYELIRIPFPTDMAEQISVGYQESPRLQPPAGAVPIQGLSVIPEEFPENPILADDISIGRGKILYSIHCEICHGANGHGKGPLASYFDRTPQNLTGPQITAEFDGSVYLTIVQGFGQMPPLSENLAGRERWDVVNYVRTLPTQ